MEVLAYKQIEAEVRERYVSRGRLTISNFMTGSVYSKEGSEFIASYSLSISSSDPESGESSYEVRFSNFTDCEMEADGLFQKENLREIGSEKRPHQFIQGLGSGVKIQPNETKYLEKNIYFYENYEYTFKPIFHFYNCKSDDVKYTNNNSSKRTTGRSSSNTSTSSSSSTPSSSTSAVQTARRRQQDVIRESHNEAMRHIQNNPDAGKAMVAVMTSPTQTVIAPIAWLFEIVTSSECCSYNPMIMFEKSQLVVNFVEQNKLNPNELNKQIVNAFVIEYRNSQENQGVDVSQFSDDEIIEIIYQQSLKSISFNEN